MRNFVLLTTPVARNSRFSAILIVTLAGAMLLGSTVAWAQPTEQEAKLLASDGAANDRFGYAVAVDGDTALIGAHLDDDNGDDSGSAYVFTRSAGVWTEQAKLLAPDGAQYESFGYSVALDGDTAVIGARDDDDNAFEAGSAYVFTRTAGVWNLQAKLLPPDGELWDHFGEAAALDGDTAIIGTSSYEDGRAYVYVRSGNVWNLRALLRPSDGALDSRFAESVTLDGDTAIIGAFWDDDDGLDSGSAYVFTGADAVWTEQAKLLASDASSEAFFGFALALREDTAFVGAPGDDVNGEFSGSAYVFTRSAGVWTEQAKLVPGGGGPDDIFGVSVALDGDTAIVGASGESHNGPGAGAAYVFVGSAGSWTLEAKLQPSDLDINDGFGRSISLDGGTGLIGTYRDDDNGEFSGSAYVFGSGAGGDGGDGGVPAVGGSGTILTLLAVAGIGLYFVRRGVH